MSLTQLIAAAKKRQVKHLPDYTKYKYDPIGFCNDILHVTLTKKQAEIAESLMKPPHRTLVRSANGVGKTVTAACLCCWHYATRNPSMTICTAPNAKQVSDALFREIRRVVTPELRSQLYPKLPRMESSPHHCLQGYTALDATSFQGIHERSMMVCFEEAVGIDIEFFDAAFGLLQACEESFFLAICNPTDVGSAMYQYEQSGRWNVVEISAFDHENIINELKHEPPLIPTAIRLEHVRLNMDEWGEYVTDHYTSEYAYMDVEFEDKWWRPGPLGDSRILGRWASLSAYSIFSESDFRTALNSTTTWTDTDLYQIGVDIARFGSDKTAIHVRRGNVSTLHESFTGQDTHRTANRLKELATKYAEELQVPPYKIVVRVDDSGVGGGVTDQRGNFNFVPVNSATTAVNELKYPNKRSELMFLLQQKLRNVANLSLLPKHVVYEIKRQALGILYAPDNKGRRVAERKEDTKKRINRSPDDLDAMCLAYYDGGTGDYTPHAIDKENLPLIRPKAIDRTHERNRDRW
jgi:hypothetical protein